MAIVEVSIVPIGTGSTSVSQYVAAVEKVLMAETSVKPSLTAMGTIIEGDLDTILAVIRKMHESVFSGEVRRVVTLIRIDDRRDKKGTIEGKVESVQRKLRAGK